MPDVLYYKDPDATLDYAVDWTNWLDGDAITVSAWTVPADLSVTSSTNTTTKATLGQDYQIAAHWCSLHTSNPGKNGQNEATGSPYARKAVTQFTAVDDSGQAKRTRNVNALYFQMPAGTYTHVGLWTAQTSGEFLGGGALSSPATVSAGDFVIVTENDLSVLLD